MLSPFRRRKEKKLFYFANSSSQYPHKYLLGKKFEMPHTKWTTKHISGLWMIGFIVNERKRFQSNKKDQKWNVCIFHFALMKRTVSDSDAFSVTSKNTKLIRFKEEPSHKSQTVSPLLPPFRSLVNTQSSQINNEAKSSAQSLKPKRIMNYACTYRTRICFEEVKYPRNPSRIVRQWLIPYFFV